MNTTRTASQPAASSRFGSLRGLGRGIAASSAVALLGLGGMSAADAQAAGVSSGVRHTATVSATDVVKPGPTSLPSANTTRYALRDGRVTRL